MKNAGTNYQLVEKKNWPKKWGGHGRPGRCGSVALVVNMQKPATDVVAIHSVVIAA